MGSACSVSQNPLVFEPESCSRDQNGKRNSIVTITSDGQIRQYSRRNSRIERK